MLLLDCSIRVVDYWDVKSKLIDGLIDTMDASSMHMLLKHDGSTGQYSINCHWAKFKRGFLSKHRNAPRSAFCLELELTFVNCW